MNEPKKRSIYLDMDYSSMWSILDKVDTDELKEELVYIGTNQKALNQEVNELQEKQQRNNRNMHVLKEVIENRYRKDLIENFVMTDEHRKLLSKISWESEKPLESLYADEVVTILGWEKPNDSPSNKQIEDAEKLLKELPIALQEITKIKCFH